MIVFKHKGDFKNLEKFLEHNRRDAIIRILEYYGQAGVDALAENTPKDSGLTASSWGYEIRQNGNNFSIVWTNSNFVDGVPIAILLQYGHATGTGGYVQGRDYINPAIQPIFDKIAKDAWREVTNT